jgi:hypothetical protein
MPPSVVAFAAAPFLGLLVTTPLVAAAFDDFRSWGLYFFFGLFLAYPSAVLFGVPTYIALKRRRAPLRLWHAVAAGVICSGPALIAWLYPFSGLYFERAWQLNSTLAVASGGAAGAAFWGLMWRRRSNPSIERTVSGGPETAAHVKR